jgi:LysR family transcriptional regulator for bpeEF and oprC
MDRLSAMRIFSRVAELGSFSAAAAALALSRATVSSQVAALEKDLGARLLDRTTRRVALTDDGTRFLARCQRVFLELQAAEGEFGLGDEEPSGRLVARVAASLGRQLVIPALPGLLARHPFLQIDLRLGESPTDPLAEGVDIAIRGGTVSDPALVVRRAAASHWITCASPGYLEHHGWPRTPGDLAAHQLIGYQAPGAATPHGWLFREGSRQRSLRPHCRATLDDPEALLAAALQGGGIVQTLDLLAAQALERRELVVLLPGSAVRGPPVSVIYPQDGRDSTAVRVFAAFAVDLMARCQQRVGIATGLMDTP